MTTQRTGQQWDHPATLRAFWESVSQALVGLDLECRVRLWSAACERLLGYESDAVLGRPLPFLVPSDEIELVRLCQRARDEERAQIWATTCRRVGERPLRVRIEIVAVRDDVATRGYCLTLIPSSEIEPDESVPLHALREVEESLRVSNLRWQSLVEHNPDMVMLVERDSTIRYINRVAPGVTKEQIIGSRGVDYVTAEYRDLVLDQYARAWDGHETAEFVVPTHFAGQAFWHYCLLAPMIQDGKTECLLAVVRDVTGQKRAEAERAAIERGLLEAQHLESLGVIAGGIAHDFNNLIAGILGSAHLAAHECGANAPALEHLRQIEQNSFRAAELCKQMLAYAGKARFVLEPLDVHSALEGLRSLAQAVLPKSATLDYRLAEALPAIRADEAQLRHVILGLITNASEALHGGVGTVTVTTALHAVNDEYLRAHDLDRDTPPGDYVAIEVSDDGAGIAPEVRPRIFEPFFSTKFLGRGLGLAAAQGIVRAHAGLIAVWSEPGRGSRFTVLLPRA